MVNDEPSRGSALAAHARPEGLGEADRDASERSFFFSMRFLQGQRKNNRTHAAALDPGAYWMPPVERAVDPVLARGTGSTGASDDGQPRTSGTCRRSRNRWRK